MANTNGKQNLIKSMAVVYFASDEFRNLAQSERRLELSLKDEILDDLND